MLIKAAVASAALMFSSIAWADSALETAASSARERARSGTQEDLRAAISVVDRYLQSTPSVSDPSDGVVLARLLNESARWNWALGNGAAAVSHAQRAYEVARGSAGESNPLNIFLLRDVGFLKFATGDCTGAVAAYGSAFELLRKQPSAAGAGDVISALAGLYRQLGRSIDALSVVQAGSSMNGVDSATRQALDIVKAHVALDEYDVPAAERILAGLGAATRDDPARISLAARIALVNNDFESAHRILTDAIARLPASAETQQASYSEQLATLEGLRGNYAAAISGYLAAYAAYPKYDALSLPLARLSFNLGWVRRMVGDTVQAEALFEQALRGLTRCTGGEDWMTARVHLERTRLYLDQGRSNEAMQEANRARQILDADIARRPVDHAYAVAAQSLALARLGQLDESRDAMLAALTSIKQHRGSDSQDLAPGYDHLAEIAYFRGEMPDVKANAEEALRIWSKTGAQTLRGTMRAQALLAAAAASSRQEAPFVAAVNGMLDSARAYLAGAQGAVGIAVEEVRGARVSVERVLDAGADAGLFSDANPLRTAFELIQLPQLAQAGAMVSVQAQAIEGVDAQAGALLRERAALAARVRALNTRLADAWSTVGASQLNPTFTEASLKELRKLQQQLLDQNARIARSAPRLAELLRPQLAGIAELQAVLRPDEALYVQFVSTSRTHGILVTPAGVWYRVTPLSRTVIRRNVSRLRRALDLGLSIEERLPFDDAAAMELYTGTLGAFEVQLSGVNELLVVSDDAFQNLPWSVLRMPGTGSTPGPFLAERLAITVLPSAGALIALRSSRSAQRAELPFVGFGDPVLKGAGTADVRRPAASVIDELVRGPDPDAVSRLQPLPETSDELKQIAKALGASEQALHLRQAATEAAVRAENLSRYRVVSFATHGLVAGDFRGLAEPALVLTPVIQTDGAVDPANDGLLTATEITGLNLRADLVLLSACNTGRADGGAGAAGLSGLARAFFAAGARSLVVSHWSVSSAATVPLLTTALKTVASDTRRVSRSQALRQAMLAMMRGELGERYRQPAYWAPFVLVGDNGHE